VCAMSSSDIPVDVFPSNSKLRHDHGLSMRKTYFPSGENLMHFTGFLKLKWWRTTPLLKLMRRARPSEEHANKNADTAVQRRQHTVIHSYQNLAVRTQSQGCNIFPVFA
jgi:hypothetical protein